MAAETLQHRPRPRSLQAQHRPAAGDVCDDTARLVRNLVADQRLDVRVGERRRDHHVAVLGQPGDGEVGFDAADGVQKRGVHHPAHRHRHRGGGHAVQDALGVFALHQKLRERALLEQAHRFAHGAVFFGVVVEPVLAAPAVFVGGRLAGTRIPVGALPAGRFSEAGAGRGQPVVQHALLHPARGLPLAERPVVLITDAQRLDVAVVQIARVVLPGLGAANVDRPHVHRRQAGGNPLRHDHANPATGQNAQRVHAGRHKKVLQIRRRAHEVVVVRREGFRTTEKQLDAVVHQRRHARHGFFDHGQQAVPVGLDIVETEGLRDAVHAPGFGHGFEVANHDLAGLFADVGRIAGVAQDGQHLVHPGDRLGNQVVVLAGLQRHVYARHIADLAGPHAGAVHHELRRDIAAVGAHAGDLAVGLLDADDLGLLEDLRAAHAGALGERHGDVRRVDPAVVWKMKRRLHVGHIRQRPHGLDLGGGDFVALHAKGARHGATAAHFMRLLRRHGQLDGTALDKPGGLPGFGFQPAIKVLRVFGELGLGFGISQRG